MPSSSASPSSSILVGSVSPGSTSPSKLESSTPSSNGSPSVLLFLGSDPRGGLPYDPLTSTPSDMPSLSVSTAVGSVRSINASLESFKPSPSVSLEYGSVNVMPSTSAVRKAHPPGPRASTGSHGVSVSVPLSGPGWKYWVGGNVEPSLVDQAGLTYSQRLSNPSLSGSPYAPSSPVPSVGSRPKAISQPSSMPSPSVSQPSTSSSISPSPSSSLEAQSASPSKSGSAESTSPSKSSSNPFVHKFPAGSSSTPSEPFPWMICMADSSSQLLTGTVPFHQTPLSRMEGVETSSQPAGMPHRYSFRLVRRSPSGSPVEPFRSLGDRGSRPYFHSHPSGRPSSSLSQSWGCVLM